MKMPTLSVCTDDLARDVKDAMDRARALGFHALDVGATQGPVSPGELSRTGQRHLLRHMADLGLRLGSLRGPAGGAGYGDAAAGERRLEIMRGVIRLAASLNVPVVSTDLGAGSTDEAGARRLEALTLLADEADRSGVQVAIETAGVTASALGTLLRGIACPGLGACCDTGAMLMQGEDPGGVAEHLPGRIQLVRARDAVCPAGNESGYEVAHGQGRLDPERVLAGLTEAGFQGDIVLTRTSGENRAGDIALARDAFNRLLC
jgi:sugar phosphate isomerase/epimerase